MITLRQCSGMTVILGLNGEKTIIEALEALYERYQREDQSRAQYVKSLLDEVRK